MSDIVLCHRSFWSFKLYYKWPTVIMYYVLLINFDLLAFIWSNLSIQYKKLSLGQCGKNQSNTDLFRIGPIPVSPITTRSESARHFDNCKEKSREILDWLINKGIITWCFSYWPSYRSSVCCIGVLLRLRPIQQVSDL